MANRNLDDMRSRDLMRQGIMKCVPPLPPKDPRKKRIKEIKDALAGKRGYQSPWAVGLLQEELAALGGKA